MVTGPLPNSLQGDNPRFVKPVTRNNREPVGKGETPLQWGRRLPKRSLKEDYFRRKRYSDATQKERLEKAW